MLKSCTLHPFLAVSLLTAFSATWSKPFETQHVDSGLGIPSQGSFSRAVPESSTSGVGRPKPFERTHGGGLKIFKDPLEESNQEETSQGVPDLLTSSAEHSKVVIPSRVIDMENFLNSEKDLLNGSAHQVVPTDDVKETREIFKTIMMNTDNLYKFLSHDCFKVKKRWATYLGEWLGLNMPYKDFIKHIGTIMCRTQDEKMKKTLYSVANLCAFGFQDFSIFPTSKFMQHKDTIIKSLRLDCKVLEDKSSGYFERLHAIGILQYLKNSFPRNSETLADEFSHLSLNFQTALELFFTRDHEEAVQDEIEAPYTKRHEGICVHVREYFERAAFMSAHERCIREGLSGDHPQGIHLLTSRYLLGSRLPTDTKTIKLITSRLAYFIAGNELTRIEADYAIAIVSYLWKFPIYRIEIHKLLSTEQFAMNLLKTRAQEAIKSFLEEKGDDAENGKKVYQIILGLLENQVRPTHYLVQTLLDEMKSQTLDMDEKVELLRLLNAKSVIQPELRPIVLERMFQDQNDLHVSEVWSHIGSQHPISQTALDDLDTIAFKLYPALLTSSYRRVLGAKLQAQENADMKSIGESLANLPRHTQPEAGKSQELFERIEHILSTVPDAKHHFGCFEVYLHLMWYNPTISTQLINSMVHRDYFNDNILFFAERALHNIEETSGIAEIQLTEFSKVLKKIHWEIVHSAPEALNSEAISPRMTQIQLWVEQLRSITPV